MLPIGYALAAQAALDLETLAVRSEVLRTVPLDSTGGSGVLLRVQVHAQAAHVVAQGLRSLSTRRERALGCCRGLRVNDPTIDMQRPGWRICRGNRILARFSKTADLRDGTGGKLKTRLSSSSSLPLQDGVTCCARLRPLPAVGGEQVQPDLALRDLRHGKRGRGGCPLPLQRRVHPPLERDEMVEHRGLRHCLGYLRHI